MCNSERVPTLLFLYTSDWSPNWVSSCRHIERGDLRDVLRCFKKFVCLRAVCFDKILSLHLFFAMSASAFLYSMPVDTLELWPFGRLHPNFSLSPASDVDIEDISLLVFTIFDWFCELAYLLVGAADAGPTAMGGADSSSNNCFSLGEDEKRGLLPVSLLHPRHHNNFSFRGCGNSLIATKCIPAKYLYP